jgi:hypothetical protein
MTHTGKIGRLPYGLRAEINFKIRNGVPGVEILEWLNGTPETRRVLDRYFAGRPVSEQNLTEWKAGGYLAWERHAYATEWVEELVGKSEELADKADRKDLWISVADRVATMMAVELGRSLEAVVADGSMSLQERLDALLKINGALSKLRREDRSQKRLSWQVESEQLEREAEEEDKRVAAEQQAYSTQMLAGHLERHEQQREERMEALRQQSEAAMAPRAKASPEPVNQGKSGQIKADQTESSPRERGLNVAPPAEGMAPGSLASATIASPFLEGSRCGPDQANQGESNQIKVNAGSADQ